MIIDATLRRMRGNQFGLLGFGGENRSYLSRNDAENVFLAWAPVKNLSATLSWTDLGSIAGTPAQRGGYISLWLGY